MNAGETDVPSGLDELAAGVTEESIEGRRDPPSLEMLASESQQLPDPGKDVRR
jgi:hypothetical protein